MMTGPAIIKDIVSGYLKQDLPTRIVDYRNFFQLSSTELPIPEDSSYLTYAPPALLHKVEGYPVIYTAITSMSKLTKQGMNSLYDPEYEMRYDARTYVWTQSEGDEEACRSRDCLLTVVRTAILDHQSFLNYDLSGSCQLLFDETELREEYSDQFHTTGDRCLAGGYISYTLVVTEVVSREMIGEVSDIQALPVFLLDGEDGN